MVSAGSFQENIDAANFNLKSYFPESWEKVNALAAEGVKSGDPRSDSEYGRMAKMMYWHNEKNAALLNRGSRADKFSGDVYAAMLGDDPNQHVGGTLKGYDPRPQLSALQAHVLVIGGRYDRVATPEIVSQTVEMLPSGSTTLAIFEESGHRPWIEEKERYFPLLQAFLTDSKP